MTSDTHAFPHAIQPPRLNEHADRNNNQVEMENEGKYYLFQSPVTTSRIETPGQDVGNRRTERKSISCNSCRRRKVKCDKNDPCSQCKATFHDCVYAESSRRRKRRKLSSERLDAIERRLKAMESLTSLAAAPPPGVAGSLSRRNEAFQGNQVSHGKIDKTAPAEIGKCASAYHSIEQDEIEFQGYPADRTFIQGLREELGDWSVDATRSRLPAYAPIPGLFHMDDQFSDEVPLPPRAQAIKMIEAALDAQILLYIIHRPSFDVSFNLIYSLDKSEYSLREKRFLALLYAVFAYGSLFIEPDSRDINLQEFISQASRYYAKSRKLQNIADCRDLVSLQAVIFMNLFLLSTSRTFTCYTYLSASLSIAVRMGLHRTLVSTQDMISHEVGKRVFWVLRLLANDVAASCGLPKLLTDDEIDQELPREVNDIYIRKERIIEHPSSEICYLSGANAYQKLHAIRDRVIQQVYPLKSPEGVQTGSSMSYTIRLETIRGIEEDLEKWLKNIPWSYRLGKDYGELNLQRAQYMLCISYSHIQLCLYRPFLHYVIGNSRQSRSPKEGFSSYATACIQASQNIIALCEDMYKRGLLAGANWHVTRSYEADALFKGLATGRKILNHLAKRSPPGNRCKVLLAIIISALPKELEKVQERLLNFDMEAVDAIYYGDPEDTRYSPDNAYTALLAEKSFSVSCHPASGIPIVQASADRETQNCSFVTDLPHGKPKPYHDTGVHQPSAVPTDQKTPRTVVNIPIQAVDRNTVDCGSHAAQSYSNDHSLCISASSTQEEAEVSLEAKSVKFHSGSPGRPWPNSIDYGGLREAGSYEEAAPDIFGTRGLDIGDMEDLFDFQSWL